MCRVIVPDHKNGWTDCAQIWYTDRDQLLGCRERQLEASLRSSARAGQSSTSRSLACRFQKASYWLYLYLYCTYMHSMVRPVYSKPKRDVSNCFFLRYQVNASTLVHLVVFSTFYLPTYLLSFSPNLRCYEKCASFKLVASFLQHFESMI